MHRTRSTDHAPTFTVTFYQRIDKRPNGTYPRNGRAEAGRVAGKFQAWTPAEAIAQARAAGAVPRGANSIRAYIDYTEAEPEQPAPALAGFDGQDARLDTYA